MTKIVAFYLNGNETPVSDQDVNASHTNKRDVTKKRRNEIAYKIPGAVSRREPGFQDLLYYRFQYEINLGTRLYRLLQW